MSSRAAIALVIFFLVIDSSAERPRLEGCSNPKIISKALKQLQENGWGELTFTNAQKLWPEPVKALDCRGTACVSLANEGRIIAGQMQCGEVLDFDEDPSGAEGTGLKDIVLHYTAVSRHQVLDAARMYAEALGLPSGRIASLGANQRQDFQWDVAGGTRISLDLQWNRIGKYWNIYASVYESKIKSH